MVPMQIIWESVPDFDFLLRLLPHEQDEQAQEGSILMSEFDPCQDMPWCHLPAFYDQRPGNQQTLSTVCWSIFRCLECHLFLFSASAQAQAQS